jgi:hypothetical protein
MPLGGTLVTYKEKQIKEAADLELFLFFAESSAQRSRRRATDNKQTDEA